MKSKNPAIKFGILTAILLIVYFLFLGFLNLNSNPAFSFVNAVFVAVGISLAIKSEKENKGQIKYQNGFKTGLVTGILATILFSIFFISYFSFNQDYAKKLIDSIGLDVNLGLLFVTVIFMGITSTLIITLALMQLHKQKSIKRAN